MRQLTARLLRRLDICEGSEANFGKGANPATTLRNILALPEVPRRKSFLVFDHERDLLPQISAVRRFRLIRAG